MKGCPFVGTTSGSELNYCSSSCNFYSGGDCLIKKAIVKYLKTENPNK